MSDFDQEKSFIETVINATTYMLTGFTVFYVGSSLGNGFSNPAVA